VLPVNLTHLFLGDHINQPLAAGVLPVNLTHLILGDRFDQPLAAGVLPGNLTHLILGNRFNQPLVLGVLPTALIHLGVGFHFDQPLVVGVLTVSLTHATFGNKRTVSGEIHDIRDLDQVLFIFCLIVFCPVASLGGGSTTRLGAQGCRRRAARPPFGLACGGVGRPRRRPCSPRSTR
jgi:hypothetical protein